MLTPKEIFQAYADGRMDREEMLKLASEYPYAKQPPTDGYDWILPPADGPTWMEVSLAYDRGQISREDYAIIFERRHGR